MGSREDINLNARRWVPALAAVAVVALAAGCSSSSSSSASGSSTGAASSSGNTIDIYSSLPLQGASNAQTIPVVNGAKLALKQAGGKAGQFTVNFISLDDSTAAAGSWDATQTAANARKAASDPKAVYYIGEFNSGASEISIPILNQAGIPQVSPANTYVGLTTNLPGSAAGEPDKYYPTGNRTYLRIVPIDSIQAAAGLMAMKQAGCTKVSIANDQEAYGGGLAKMLGLEKAYYGVTILSNVGIDPKASNYRTLASSFKSAGTDCVYFAGITANGAVQLVKDMHAAMPTAKFFGGDGVCSSTWTQASSGGVPADIDPLMECTQPALDLAAYPGGAKFISDYKAEYGTTPDPYGIAGYEAMKLALDTITSLGAKGNDKAAVLQALFAIKDRNSVMGTYGFDKNGDTTLKSFGLYKPDKTGVPVYAATLTPTKTVSTTSG
jgi:branched-chain amino acid transport system substrate-binding protein